MQCSQQHQENMFFGSQWEWRTSHQSTMVQTCRWRVGRIMSAHLSSRCSRPFFLPREEEAKPCAVTVLMESWLCIHQGYIGCLLGSSVCTFQSFDELKKGRAGICIAPGWWLGIVGVHHHLACLCYMYRQANAVMAWDQERPCRFFRLSTSRWHWYFLPQKYFARSKKTKLP